MSTEDEFLNRRRVLDHRCQKFLTRRIPNSSNMLYPIGLGNSEERAIGTERQAFNLAGQLLSCHRDPRERKHVGKPQFRFRFLFECTCGRLAFFFCQRAKIDGRDG